MVKQDEGQSGNFRVLCDGDHDAPSVVAEEAEQVEDDALIKGQGRGVGLRGWALVRIS